jgi:aspartyl-tRNA(Asn)/glutamyl-tRNA(Gln) amidotransferase subunit C
MMSLQAAVAGDYAPGEEKVTLAVTPSEVLKIAELAKLHFSESELEAFTAQFQHILDYIEKLKEVNVEGIEPTSHVSLVNESGEHLFRADTISTSLPVEKALENAPDTGADQFRVPKVL